MRTKTILGLFVLIILTVSATYAQQQFVHTVSAANKYCNSTCSLMDIPALNNNATAIIIVTPILVNSANPNPHPVGTYFVDGKKWSIMNADNVTIADGAKFNVQYWANPTTDQFVYVIPAIGVAPCINHAVLNNNSRAQILFSITGSPRGAYFNKEEVKIQYNATALKWCVANVNGQPVKSDTAYNIVITSGGIRTTDLTKLPDTTPIGTVKLPADINPTCNCPTSLPPNGNAGGDLSGTYPNPTVQKLNGRPISNTAPQIGQMLRWNGTVWEHVTITSSGGGTTFTPGLGLSFDGTTLNTLNTEPIWNAAKLAGRDIMTTPPAVGQILKWGGGAWVPADDNVAPTTTTPPAAPMQTFFKIDNTNLNVGQATLSDLNSSRILTALSHSIVLNKKSRLIISVAISIAGRFSPVPITDGKGWFHIQINNNIEAASQTNFTVGYNANTTAHITNYMIDLNPGTYNIEFKVQHEFTKTQFSAVGNYSSIIVIPL